MTRPAGVDFLVVGEVNPNALQKYVDELEAKENKSIRYAVMSLPDFRYRQQIRDRFAMAIAQSKKTSAGRPAQLIKTEHKSEEEGIKPVDLQFYGANCVSVIHKGTRVVIDDNLAELGAKSVIKPDDVALFTGPHGPAGNARLTLDGPGEYEVSDISIIVVIAARAHIDEAGQLTATMFKLMIGDSERVVTGHIYPELSEAQLETIGMVDRAGRTGWRQWLHR